MSRVEKRTGFLKLIEGILCLSGGQMEAATVSTVPKPT